MIGLFLKKVKDERGQAIVEFALSFPLFLLFISGLFLYAYWFIGAHFLQDAAYDAARKYAVTLNSDSAQKVFDIPAKRWAFAFLDKESIKITFERMEDGRVRTVATGEPVIKRFLFFSVPSIQKEAVATLEYRFRSPGSFTK